MRWRDGLGIVEVSTNNTLVQTGTKWEREICQKYPNRNYLLHNTFYAPNTVDISSCTRLEELLFDVFYKVQYNRYYLLYYPIPLRRPLCMEFVYLVCVESLKDKVIIELPQVFFECTVNQFWTVPKDFKEWQNLIIRYFLHYFVKEHNLNLYETRNPRYFII